MENKKIFKLFKFIINFALFCLTMAFIFNIMFCINNDNMTNTSKTINLIYGLVGVPLAFFVLLKLKSIVKSIELKDPFTIKNVKIFKGISIIIFSFGLLDIILRYPYTSGTFLVTDHGSVSLISVFVYIILGCLSLLLSNIFSQAMAIKNENDMTI